MTGFLRETDAIGQAELVRRGEVTPRELVENAINRIELVDPEINALTHRRYELALDEAEQVSKDVPFPGVPILSKALNETIGDPATFGSAWVGRSGRVGKKDAPIIKRMKEAGFVVLGQTSSPEFGVLSVSESGLHGITRNPWRTDLTPGGSSGGASAAVAGGMVPVAQGGDGGGSIRMPASFCDLVGLKPTVGRISGGPGVPSRWGHSVPAVVTRTVRDTAAVLDAIAGPEVGDIGSPPPLPDPGLSSFVNKNLGPLRIGVLDHAPEDTPSVTHEVRGAVRETADLLSQAGHEVESSYPPAMLESRVLDAFFTALSVTVVQSVDGLAREIGPPGPGDLDPITEFWLTRGRAISGLELADTFNWQGEFRVRMASWWADGFDLLLCPVFASAPKYVSWPWMEPDGIDQSLRVLGFTAPFNTTGQPAISVPAVVTNQREPIGVQLVAPLGREDILVAVASQLEEVRPWKNRHPPVFAV